MADEGREDREGREDLFEDLDKFFAPIQDVDWPETVEPTEGEAAAPTAPGPEPSSSEGLFGEREPEPAAAEPPAEEPPAETEERGPREEPGRAACRPESRRRRSVQLRRLELMGF